MNSVFLIGIPSGPEWFVVLFALFLPLLCIVDIIRSEFRHPYAKLVWCLMVIFVPFIGSLLYYWIGTEQKVVSRG